MGKSSNSKTLREIKYPTVKCGLKETFRFIIYFGIIGLASVKLTELLNINIGLHILLILSLFSTAVKVYFDYFCYKLDELNAGRLVLLRSQVTNPLYDPDKVEKIDDSLSADLPYILTLSHDYNLSALVSYWTKPFHIASWHNDLTYTSDWSFHFHPNMASPKRYEFLTIVDQWIKWTIHETDSAFTPAVMSFRRRLLEKVNKLFNLDDDSTYPTNDKGEDKISTIKKLYEEDASLIKDVHLRTIAKKLLYDLSIQFQGTDSGKLVGLISQFVHKKEHRWISDEPPYNTVSMGPVDLGDDFFNEYHFGRGIFSIK
jgi:hypothetical protein